MLLIYDEFYSVEQIGTRSQFVVVVNVVVVPVVVVAIFNFMKIL